ncbi:DASH complex subunit Ask1-domain-containing protein [Myxozyma melibiosi]|uniref:DASH complex subunit ASK1 n=1 Tax=Myxozyma melibiosi TaxID=54550 RepID=A0ABR1F942_9ASCO
MDRRTQSLDPRKSIRAPRPSIAYTSRTSTTAASAASLRAPAQAPMSVPRSLTEELEKIEQSITLTLQEIDHNFSTSHRIITSAILPIVEQYAVQSQAVWQSSKFWKEFFESSANVSLAGYEELNTEDGQQAQPDQYQNQTAEASQIDTDEYSATMDYDYNTEVKTPGQNYDGERDEDISSAGNMTGVDDDESSFVAYVGTQQQQQQQQRQQQQSRAPNPAPEARSGIARFKYDDEEELEIEATLAGATQFIKSLNLDSQSTPRAVLAERSNIVNASEAPGAHPSSRAQNAGGMQWADMVSPFEEMRSELKGITHANGSFDSTNSIIPVPQVTSYGEDEDDLSLSPPKQSITTSIPNKTAALPRTPNRYASRPANSTIDEEDSAAFHTPESSPFSPYAGMRAPGSVTNYNRTYTGGNQQQNVLLHRVLDRKWGIQATPKQPKLPSHRQAAQLAKLATPKNNHRAMDYQTRFDSSPMDSPPAVAHLNSNIFSSPDKD